MTANLPFDSLKDHLEYMALCRQDEVNEGLHSDEYGHTQQAHMKVFAQHGDRELEDEAWRVFGDSGLDGFFSWLSGLYC